MIRPLPISQIPRVAYYPVMRGAEINVNQRIPVIIIELEDWAPGTSVRDRPLDSCVSVEHTRAVDDDNNNLRGFVAGLRLRCGDSIVIADIEPLPESRARR